MPATAHEAHLDLAAVMAALTEDIVKGEDPPEAVIDRYFTSDVVQVSDGSRFGRDELIAHVRPVRKNLADFEYQLHDSVSDGDRLAARYTLHGRMRNGRSIATEAYAFGERAADGRAAPHRSADPGAARGRPRPGRHVIGQAGAVAY